MSCAGSAGNCGLCVHESVCIERVQLTDSAHDDEVFITREYLMEVSEYDTENGVPVSKTDYTPKRPRSFFACISNGQAISRLVYKIIEMNKLSKLEDNGRTFVGIDECIICIFCDSKMNQDSVTQNDTRNVKLHTLLHGTIISRFLISNVHHVFVLFHMMNSEIHCSAVPKTILSQWNYRTNGYMMSALLLCLFVIHSTLRCAL